MKESLRAVHAVNEAGLKRQYDPACSILIVEGADDKKLYGSFTHSARCRIVIAHGRQNVIDATITLRNAKTSGILGIIDSDYFVVSGVHTKDPDILLTDHHDLEMMLLLSPAIDKIIREHGEEQKCTEAYSQTGIAPIGIILKPACEIGLFRWAARKNEWKFKFDGMNYRRFISERTLEFNTDEFIHELQSHSGIGGLDKSKILEATALLAKQGAPPEHICCGHDAVQILGIALRRLLGSRGEADTTPARIEKDLRLAYEVAFFKSTNLFAEIKAWETRNNPFVVIH